MTPASPTREVPRSAGLLLSVVQVVGLIGTGAIVWHISVVPRLRFESPVSIVIQALKYAVLAWGWSAAITLGLSATVLQRDIRTAASLALRTARTAVWFAPACILLSNLSPAALLPALALIYGATQMVYAQIASAPVPSAPAAAAEPFQLLPSPLILRTLAPAFAASLGLQSGLVAAATGYPLLGAAFFAIAAVMAISLLLAAGLLEADPKRSLPRSILGVFLTIILAAGLTTVHVLSRYPGGEGIPGDEPGAGHAQGPVDSLRALMKKLAEPDEFDTDAPDDTGTHLFNTPDSGVDITDSVFPGVVLKAGLKPYTLLVAPRPSWIHGSAVAFSDRPFSIPFSGEYWMYKPPNTRPPKGAITREGSPLALFYRTTDHRRMTMEARQRLDHPIELACCRAVGIAIANADSRSGTLAFELILSDTRSRRQPPLSLGRNPVRSRPADVHHPVPEILEYPLPKFPALSSFNELRVILHRDLVRADKSARISIERWIFVPRT